MTRLPRLLDSSLNEVRRINPITGSLNLTIIPLSTASLTLPPEEEIPIRSWVEIYSPFGSAGIYRSKAPKNGYGDTETTVELEHAVTEVGDYICETDVEESTTLSAAMAKIWTYYKGSKWQLGTISQTDTVILDIDYDNVLESILSLLEQTPGYMLTFDFSTSPWTLGLASRGTTVTAEGRLGRNVTDASVNYDESELCTRVYIPYDNDGDETYSVINADATTIANYGVIEKRLSGGSYTQAQAAHVANVYLNKHKKPKVGVEINGLDLSEITGESLDSFTIGKMFRLAIPKYSVTVEDCVTALSYEDLYSEDDAINVTVSLADAEDAVIEYIRQQRTSQNAARKSGGRGGRKQAEENKEFWTAINRNDYAITLEAYQRLYGDEYNYSQIEITASHIMSEVAQTANGLYSRIEQTASYLHTEIVDTASGLQSQINQTASQISTLVETASGLQSQITQTASQISLKVDKNGVISAIEQSSETIKISASKIDLVGYVTADTLAADIARAGDLTVNGTIRASTYYLGSGVSPVSLGSGVYDLKITHSGNTYTLQKQTYSNASWVDVDSFSRAITSDSWSWVGGSAKVTLQPQGQDFYSPAIDLVAQHGQVTWDADNKGFSVDLDVDDSNGTTVYQEQAVHFSTLTSYNAGSSSVTVDSVVKDGTTTYSANYKTVYIPTTATASNGETLTVNVSSDISTAYDQGVAEGEGKFSLASVTLQGAAHGSITPILTGQGNSIRVGSAITSSLIDSSTSLRLGAATTLYEAGTSTVVGRGTSVTRYTAGEDKTYYLRNTTATRFTSYMSVMLYRRTGTSTYTEAGNHDWYYKVSSGGTAYYTSNGTANVTLLGSSGTYYQGNGGTYTVQGSAVTAREVVSSGGTVYYQADTAETYYPALGSGGTVYYKAGSAITDLYDEGQTVTDTYYTKTASS